MKEIGKLNSDTFYTELANILRIANAAVDKALQENRELGIPEIYVLGGKLHYVLPNGEVTTKMPPIME